jgi:hypothetical protein
MKVSEVTRTGEKEFKVEMTPTFFEKYFLLKKPETLMVYKAGTFERFPSLNAYIDVEGEVIGSIDPITKAVNNFERKESIIDKIYK